MDQGHRRVERELPWVCGVDEAGRGCLAGPIVAAAVILDPNRPIEGLADSKALTAKMRSQLEGEIRSKASAFGIGWANAAEIDRRGIEWCNRIAFTRAVRDLLRRSPLHSIDSILVVIDGNRRALRLGATQKTVIGGDKTLPAVQAASILAKTARDRYVMERLHRLYPQYGFDRHKGYATRFHINALRAWGPAPEHRMSFRLGGMNPGEVAGS